MQQTNIVIEMKGGMITFLGADNKHLDITLIDYDLEEKDRISNYDLDKVMTGKAIQNYIRRADNFKPIPNGTQVIFYSDDYARNMTGTIEECEIGYGKYGRDVTYTIKATEKIKASYTHYITPDGIVEILATGQPIH